MRDYYAAYEDGRQIAVADLPTSEIHEMLRDGIKPLGGDQAPAIIERLRLELFIRERNLRQ